MDEGKSLVKAKPEPLVEVVDDACWEVLEPSQVSPTGMKVVRVPFPRDLDDLSPAQEAMILLSQKEWAGNSFANIFGLILRGRKLGLDVARGEIYSVGGRWSTSDEAKIRCARQSGKIEYVRVGELEAGTNLAAGGKADIFCRVEIKHVDESEPQSYIGWLSEWKNSKNDNWATRPNDALQRKTLARLCNRMFPLGMTDADDFVEATAVSPKALELEKALTEGLGKAETGKAVVRTDPDSGVITPLKKRN